MKKRRSADFFFEQVNNFVIEYFEASAVEDFPFFFAAFINSKDTKTKFISQQVKNELCEGYTEEQYGARLESKIAEVDKIHDMLYRFTHDKMSSFFEYNQLTFLFKTYVKQAKEFIPKGFRDQLDTMLELADN